MRPREFRERMEIRSHLFIAGDVEDVRSVSDLLGITASPGGRPDLRPRYHSWCIPGFEDWVFHERTIDEAVLSGLELARTQSIVLSKLPADLKREVVISVHPDGSEQLIETTLSAETLAELGRLNLALHIDITPFDR